MIDRDHGLSIKRQAALVGISRGNVYYRPKEVNAIDLALMNRIDELCTWSTRSWGLACSVINSIELVLQWVASMSGR